MSYPRITTVALLAVSLCFGLGVGTSSACAICVTIGDPFKLPHPHAIRIVVASRNAQDEGILRSVTTESQGTKSLEADTIRFANNYFGAPQSGTHGPLLVDILLVDEPALYRIEVVRSQIHVERLSKGKHRAAQVRLVTTTSVIASLGRFDLTVAEAVKQGLLEVEGDHSVVPGWKTESPISDPDAGKTGSRRVSDE